MSYKNPETKQMSMSQAISAGILLKQSSEYFGKYEVSFQFWGIGNNNVFIEKDGVDLYSTGGHESPCDAIKAALDYLDRINNKEREYNPYF